MRTATNRQTTSRPTADPKSEEREKVIVRSNGVVTYVGKDIAYQFWKLGLLGRDFHYRVFRAAAARDRSGRRAAAGGRGDHPLFGGAAYVYNVIDVRQSYLQKLLKQALIAVGHPEGAERLASLLVRDGGAVARDRPRARLRAASRIQRTRRRRSSRCRAARGSASRPTTCSTR